MKRFAFAAVLAVLSACATVPLSTVEQQGVSCADPVIQAELASGVPQQAIATALATGTVNATPALQVAEAQLGPAVLCLAMASATDAEALIKAGIANKTFSTDIMKAQLDLSKLSAYLHGKHTATVVAAPAPGPKTSMADVPDSRKPFQDPPGEGG